MDAINESIPSTERLAHIVSITTPFDNGHSRHPFFPTDNVLQEFGIVVINLRMMCADSPLNCISTEERNMISSASLSESLSEQHLKHSEDDMFGLESHSLQSMMLSHGSMMSRESFRLNTSFNDIIWWDSDCPDISARY